MRRGVIAAAGMALALALSTLPAVAGDARQAGIPADEHAAELEEVTGPPDVDVREGVAAGRPRRHSGAPRGRSTARACAGTSGSRYLPQSGAAARR